jgi:hypothetical protein
MKFSIHFAWGLGLAAALAGCGGGGGGTSPTTEPATTPLSSTTVSGVALNSYLENATVFLDVNGDGVLNNGEPSATTNANGMFSFATTESLAGRFLVLKATTATKMDGVLLNQGMTFMAPAEKPGVVSPLTTDVVAKMKNNPNWSVDEAKSAVQSDLGLDASLDVMKDYIKEKSNNGAYAKVQNVSTVVSALLKTVEAQSTSSTPVSTRLAALNTEINTKLLPIINDVKNAADVTAAKERLEARIQELANNSGGFQKPNSAPGCVTNANIAWLTDYAAGATSAGCVTPTYVAQDQLIDIPNTSVPLSRTNIRALIDADPQTTGIAPNLSIIIKDSPTINSPQESQLRIALTKAGTSSQVNVTLNVEALTDNNKLIIRSRGETANVNVTLGGSPLNWPITFTTADIIASTSSSAGNVMLDVNVLGLLTKLDAFAALLSSYPSAGDYSISITKTAGPDWPYQTISGQQINGVRIGLPIK